LQRRRKNSIFILKNCLITFCRSLNQMTTKKSWN
jgi:hypothetical protein